MENINCRKGDLRRSILGSELLICKEILMRILTEGTRINYRKEISGELGDFKESTNYGKGGFKKNIIYMSNG